MKRAAVAAVLLLGGCGGGGEEPRTDPFRAIEEEFERDRSVERAAPRWERLTAIHGEGSGSRTVSVERGAIQWRIRWRCSQGDMKVTVEPASAGPSTIAGRCPGRGTGTLIGTGGRTLQVETQGTWRLAIEQQVETAIADPPISGGRLVARGRVRSIERPSRGEALLYRLGSGRLALRLEGFRTSANTDLFVWLSRARDPRTTRQARSAPYRVLRGLKSTLGDQNYLLPRSIGRDDFRSVVIWCEPIRIAYAAARLDQRLRAATPLAAPATVGRSSEARPGARASRLARGRSPGTGGPSR